MSSIKRIFFPALIVILSCFIGIALVELALRSLAKNDPWKRTKEANILRNVQFSYDIISFHSGIP